jgi:2',3'-cyclic-nucleotide 2'-phosphodiesterase (5'-nucleotidase family)
MQRLVIYHTSDIHAARGFGEQLAAIVEPGALLVDCGDALAGSSTFYHRREPVVDELAKAPYGAMAVGNREFNYLHQFFLARARAIRAPLVCSNLIDLWGRVPVFAREVNANAGGLTVRILALLAPQYRTGSGWERIFGWRFLAPQRALEELLSCPSRADATILLSHLGLPADVELARTTGRLAAILGGHTHDVLTAPQIVNNVPIAHPGAHAKHVGRLELAIDEKRAASVVSYRLISLRGGLAAEAQHSHPASP